MHVPYLTSNQRRTPSYQQGNILVLFTISLLTLITIAALALDGGHLLLNKGRLQNLVDAAALHAAIELHDGASHQQARASVVESINLNLAHQDLRELSQIIDLDSVDVNSAQMTNQLNVEFSQRPDPFVVDNDPSAKYVKVVLTETKLSNFLAQVFDFNKQITASALAGASTAIVECFQDITPMMVCGDKDAMETPNSIFGIAKNELFLMKSGSNNDSLIGPGNFQLIRLGDNRGGNDIRDAMAGKQFGPTEVCFTPGDGNDSVPTEPGDKVGPSLQGLNTRFGIHKGPVDEDEYPGDTNTCEGTTIDKDATVDAFGKIVDPDVIAGAYRFGCPAEDEDCTSNNGYSPDNTLAAEGPALCTAGPSVTTTGSIESNTLPNSRREINVVIGDCTGEANGANNVDYLGVGCFFLTQKIGNGGQNSFVVGEFFKKCSTGGKPSGVAEDNPGPFTIVLYHVPNSKDS